MTIARAVEELRSAGFKRSDRSPLVWKKVRDKKVVVAVVHVSANGDSAKIKYLN